MAQVATASPAQSKPRAGRWKWALPLLTAAALLPAWIAWDVLADRRLAAELAAIRTADEPVHLNELPRNSVPDAENAALLFQAAAAALAPNVEPPASSNLTYSGYPPYPSEWHQLANAAVAANGPALARAHAAAQFPVADWGPPALRTFNTMRELANLTADAAVHAHLHGNDALALQRVRDAIYLGDAVGQDPGLIGRLVGIGIASLAIDRLEVIAADNLKIGANVIDGAATATSNGATSTSQLQQLIADLLDDGPQLRYRRLALLAHRAEDYDECASMIGRATVLQPMLKLEAARVIQYDTVVIQAAAAPDWPAVQQQMATVGGLLTPDPHSPYSFSSSNVSLPRLSRVASATILGSQGQGRYLIVEWRALTERHVAAISLAVRWYYTIHHHWPATLSELIPQQLPVVPTVPARDGEQPMGYVVFPAKAPCVAPRPMLWFDPPGITGTTAPPPNDPAIAYSTFEQRQWRDLSLAWRATTQPATSQP